MSAPAQQGVAVAFRTLGCKVNRVESDTVARELLAMGGRLVDESEADVVVVNTCTVTGEADAKARKAVRRALRSPSRPLVVVTGCLAALDAEGLRALDSRVIVDAEKDALAARVAELVGARGAPHGSPVSARMPSPTDRAAEGFRTRAMVKVQDGCDTRCTYCIVPDARGLPRSVPAAQVLAECEQLVSAGACEIVLTGINLGNFESDGLDLPGLTAQVAQTGVARLRISSVEPLSCTHELAAVMQQHSNVVRHLHLPLQSGSDPVLAAMGRGYTTEKFEADVQRLRAVVPDIALTTDVIAGFPGETDADHEATIALCERVGFSRLHVFRYSPRAGTPAAGRADQVPTEVTARRAEELRRLDAALRERFLESRLGSEVEILVERIEGDVAEGTTREYLRVRVPAGEYAVGELVRCQLTREMVAGEE